MGFEPLTNALLRTQIVATRGSILVAIALIESTGVYIVVIQSLLLLLLPICMRRTASLT
jgi:hypothetical protein